MWRLAGGLAEALEAIHAHGLVHRDLKPGNILIAADGPRVIDFGISRTTSGTVVTATRMTIGTPAYMSPEQAEGNPVGPASDVFSLGSVLVFAATGVAPFGGGEMFAIAYRVVHGEPDLTRVPASLRPVIDACLAKDPAARPAPAELMHAVAVSSAAYPAVAPGKFWPDQVSALLESPAFTPAVPPLTQAPLLAPATQASHHPGEYAPTDVAVRRRRGPRWLLPAALGTAVAAGAGVAIALAVSPAPKPPGYLTGGSGSPAVTAAGSPAAVTVCTAPAGGCTLAGDARDMTERPQQIEASGNGAQAVTGLTWTGWGGPQATATGTLRVSDCQPNCASGKVTGYPATVTVFRPDRVRQQRQPP